MQAQISRQKNVETSHASGLAPSPYNEALLTTEFDVNPRELQATEESTEAVTSTQDPSPRVYSAQDDKSLTIDRAVLCIERSPG